MRNPEPALDADGLRGLIDRAKASGQWDQSEWLQEVPGCGTSMCLAGFQVFEVLGLEPARRGEGASGIVTYGAAVYKGQVRPVAEIAAESLGLNKHEQDELFYSGNDAVEEVVDRIIAGEYR